jgi:hypothetical protein
MKKEDLKVGDIVMIKDYDGEYSSDFLYKIIKKNNNFND